MRNKYLGKCYVCGKMVERGQGHFERMNFKQHGRSGWRVQCAEHPRERKIKEREEARNIQNN